MKLGICYVTNLGFQLYIAGLVTVANIDYPIGCCVTFARGLEYCIVVVVVLGLNFAFNKLHSFCDCQPSYYSTLFPGQPLKICFLRKVKSKRNPDLALNCTTS